jgi:hypothetical protein
MNCPYLWIPACAGMMVGYDVDVIIRLDRMIQGLDCPIKSGNDNKDCRSG